jgi:TPR repeat protein
VTLYFCFAAQIEKAKKAAKLAKREKILQAKSKSMYSDKGHTEATIKDQAIYWLERAVSSGHSNAMVCIR